MISAIDYLDIDVSNLLSRYIDTKIKNNKVIFHGDHLDKPILIEEN